LSEDQNLKKRMMDAAANWNTRQQLPVNEPFLIQIDNNISDLIKKIAKSENAPELESLIIRVSHLERTTNYDKWGANSKWMKTLHHLSKLQARYKRNPVICNLIEDVRDHLHTVIKGDAYKGSRVNNVVRVAGSDRTLNLMQHEQQRKKRGIL